MTGPEHSPVRAYSGDTMPRPSGRWRGTTKTLPENYCQSVRLCQHLNLDSISSSSVVELPWWTSQQGT